MDEIAARGLRQYQLAILANLTPAAISIILKRKSARIATLNKIGKALNLDPRDLLI